MRRYILGMFLFAAAIGPALAQAPAAPAVEPPPAPAPEATPSAAPPAAAPAGEATVDLDRALAERSLGSPDAPVTLTEFSSLTCPHCAAFHVEALPEIKAKYIDTGKVRLVLRDFPLDRGALFGAMLARCAPTERYFGFIEVLFKTQSKWARTADPVKALAQIGKLGGVSQAQFDACVASQPLIDGLLKLRLDAEQKFSIQSTPTFVLNNGAKRIEGAQPFERFAEAIESLLPK